MNDNENLQQLIQSSFIANDKKQTLFDYLNTQGATEEFFKLFDQYLVEETEKIKNRYMEIIKGFDSKAATLDQETNAKKEQLSKDLEVRLSNAELNAGEEDATWDEYYRALDKLREDYQAEIKKITSEAVLSTL
ncbi:MAG TPA: hypothetical protein VMX18_04070 [Candidatus Bipolaricaulota bacterium]|nr:hypothetical protein [Candidatus Bipolaricaulota bacterium]